MKVIGLTVDFIKIVKLWRLSTEFYGVWQLFALHHKTHICYLFHTMVPKKWLYNSLKPGSTSYMGLPITHLWFHHLQLKKCILLCVFLETAACKPHSIHIQTINSVATILIVW